MLSLQDLGERKMGGNCRQIQFNLLLFYLDRKGWRKQTLHENYFKVKLQMHIIFIFDSLKLAILFFIYIYLLDC